MNRLDEDIKNAIIMANNPSDDYESMSDYSRIYQNTTEDIKTYQRYLQGEFKTALLPTSSGDHTIEALLNGIDDITSFDLNRLARYYAELKFNAIKNLSRKDYIIFMYENMLNKEIFDYMKDSLDDDIRIFWEELYNNCSIQDIQNHLFRCLAIIINNYELKGNELFYHCALNFTSYLDDSNYKLVQQKLANAKISYLEGNILNLSASLNGKFDIINLTNIYEFVNKVILNGGAKLYADTIKDLINNLNENGKMLITYLYNCDLEDVKNYQNKSLLYIYNLIYMEANMFGLFHDKLAKKYNTRTIMQKMYAFRNTHLLRYLKNLDIEMYEIAKTGFGCGVGKKDLALIYTKH